MTNSYEKLTDVQKNFINALSDLLAEFNADNSESTTETVTPAATSIPAEKDPSADPVSSDSLVLGKVGKSYIFNYDAIKKLVDDDTSKKKIAELAGVNVITMSKYLDESGLCKVLSRSHGDDEVVNTKKKVSADIPTTPATKPDKPSKPKKRWGHPEDGSKTIEEIRDSIPNSLRSQNKCPVCGKLFVPAPQHIYRNPKNNAKVCSYTCARKVGFQ